MTRTVAITGMGIVSPIGVGIDPFWAAARSGHSGVDRIRHFDPSEYPTQIAGQVEDFALSDWSSTQRPRRHCRAAQYALAASGMALQDAGLAAKSADLTNAGVYFGTGLGGGPDLETAYDCFFSKRWRRMPPTTIPKAMPNAIANSIAIEHGMRGPNVTVANACVSSAEAAAQAFEAVRSGRLDVALAGGAESMLWESTMASWCQLGALSARNDAPAAASRPFDRDRDGMVMAEGAGVLLLEEEGRARARGATIYARVLGSASNCDASHITVPDAAGQADAILQALRDARIDADRVDCVSAHGTSTQLNDVVETRAIKDALGRRAEQIAIAALKSMTGHMMGAAGAAQLIATALTLRDGELYPTINLDNPDPECDLDYVAHTARRLPAEIALSNHFALGGSNTVVVLGR
ncbi:MAG: beta-ketoacyl-[acyl-carrier-protein] synthase family protein [Planctomycetota bacterium]